MTHTALDWLPADPKWSEKIKTLSAREEIPFADACALANCRLDFLQTNRLARLFADKMNDIPAERRVRLAVLGSMAADNLAAGITVAGLRRNLWIEVYSGAYGQFRQELDGASSPLHEFKPDALLFAFHAEAILGGDNPGAADDAILEDAVLQLRALWRQASTLCHGQVLQQTFLPIALPLMGSNEQRMVGSVARLTERMNARLREISVEEGVDLLALDSRAARDGLSAWHNPTLWHYAKQLVTPAAAPFYGDMVARLLAGRRGGSAKCLVLDLDNILWGGVIGEDGLAGITLGQGSALGEAFAAFQSYVKALSRRGVILAVCSKNDMANALEPFEKHPEMILKRSDIACFVANWQDKAANIRHIAQSLNIGLDALVFLDDDAFERNLIRRELPMVSIPELPADPALYAGMVADAGYFEAVRLTTEDLERAGQYQNRAAGEALRQTSTNLEGYLSSLSMRLVWSPFDAVGSPRIAQLANKTNQFNLTTRRYSESDVADIMADEGALTLQLRLLDRFGDNGIIAILVARQDDEKAFRIESWLMSCRVLGRRIEEATLSLLAERARKWGAQALIGEYRPTKKNDMVRDLYARLGFNKVVENPDGASLWRLDLAGFEPPDIDIAIVEAAL